ncbi:MAG: TetR/AcrR family transcriptional regulator [Actinobacteria bacterium]|nr:TetR/AcrR family transcriptional regulator [Actinomycetota bacterium]
MPHPAEPPPRGDARAEQRRRTEARILAAASDQFVEAGYERTTIRAIAQAAGVDAGLVMHYFGSKLALFEQVTKGGQLPPAPTGPPGQVAEQILAQLAGSLTTEPVRSLAMLRSMLTHPETTQAFREGTQRFRAQLAAAIPAPDADTRAALISALIMGVVMDRHLLKSGGLDTADPDQIIALLRPVLRTLTTADPPPDPA